jgi:hypothetical protein
MVRSALIGAAALALSVTAAPAAEDTSSANYIMPGCRDAATEKPAPMTLFKSPFCMGIIEGISFMGQWVTLELESNPVGQRRISCLSIPDGVTVNQKVRVVVAYIDARPARMHENFKVLTIEALRAAWPCK